MFSKFFDYGIGHVILASQNKGGRPLKRHMDQQKPAERSSVRGIWPEFHSPDALGLHAPKIQDASKSEKTLHSHCEVCQKDPGSRGNLGSILFSRVLGRSRLYSKNSTRHKRKHPRRRLLVTSPARAHEAPVACPRQRKAWQKACGVPGFVRFA